MTKLLRTNTAPKIIGLGAEGPATIAIPEDVSELRAGKKLGTREGAESGKGRGRRGGRAAARVERTRGWCARKCPHGGSLVGAHAGASRDARQANHRVHFFRNTSSRFDVTDLKDFWKNRWHSVAFAAAALIAPSARANGSYITIASRSTASIVRVTPIITRAAPDRPREPRSHPLRTASKLPIVVRLGRLTRRPCDVLVPEEAEGGRREPPEKSFGNQG